MFLQPLQLSVKSISSLLRSWSDRKLFLLEFKLESRSRVDSYGPWAACSPPKAFMRSAETAYTHVT